MSALFLLKRPLYFIRRLARDEKRVCRELCTDFYLSMNYVVVQPVGAFAESRMY